MELKEEIVELINKLPNEVLGELLQYLRQVEKILSRKSGFHLT